LDKNKKLEDFSYKLEESVKEAVENAYFTKDLACLVYKDKKYKKFNFIFYFLKYYINFTKILGLKEIFIKTLKNSLIK